MAWWQLVVIGAGAALLLYAVVVLGLVVAGRRELARAVATFVPDCVILFQRLVRDPRVPTRYKLLLGAIIPYLALPFDLIPDFIPVAGYLDDAVVVAFVLRVVLRRTGPSLLEQHWPGPAVSLDLLVRLCCRP